MTVVPPPVNVPGDKNQQSLIREIIQYLEEHVDIEPGTVHQELSQNSSDVFMFSFQPRGVAEEDDKAFVFLMAEPTGRLVIMTPYTRERYPETDIYSFPSQWDVNRCELSLITVVDFFNAR